MPEATLLAFADHGVVGDLLPSDGGDFAETLAAFESSGVDVEALGKRLQDEGADAFVKSWVALMERLVSKSKELVAAQ